MYETGGSQYSPTKIRKNEEKHSCFLNIIVGIYKNKYFTFETIKTMV